MRAAFICERDQMREFGEQIADRYPCLTLRRSVVRYAAVAIAIIAAGI